MEYGRCLLSKIFCIAFVFLAFCFVHYFSLDALNRIVGSLLPVLHVCAFAFERFSFQFACKCLYCKLFLNSHPNHVFGFSFGLLFFIANILSEHFEIVVSPHSSSLFSTLTLTSKRLSVYDHDTFKLSTYVTYSCYDGMG